MKPFEANKPETKSSLKPMSMKSDSSIHGNPRPAMNYGKASQSASGTPKSGNRQPAVGVKLYAKMPDHVVKMHNQGNYSQLQSYKPRKINSK